MRRLGPERRRGSGRRAVATRRADGRRSPGSAIASTSAAIPGSIASLRSPEVGVAGDHVAAGAGDRGQPDAALGRPTPINIDGVMAAILGEIGTQRPRERSVRRLARRRDPRPRQRGTPDDVGDAADRSGEPRLLRAAHREPPHAAPASGLQETSDERVRDRRRAARRSPRAARRAMSSASVGTPTSPSSRRWPRAASTSSTCATNRSPPTPPMATPGSAVALQWSSATSALGSPTPPPVSPTLPSTASRWW